MTIEEQIFLNEDQVAVGLREAAQLKNVALNMRALFNAAKPLNREQAKTMLYLIEAYQAKLCELLQVSTNGQAEFESRYAQLRSANAKIRELEQQQGEAVTPKRLMFGLQNLTERIEGWWRKEGLGHTSEVIFKDGVCRATFSCLLFGDFRMVDSESPISDKEKKRQWYESLRVQGFDIIERHNERGLADNDANRAALKMLFAKWLPSATIFTMSSMRSAQLEVQTLREFEVVIRNMEEVAALPGIPER